MFNANALTAAERDALTIIVADCDDIDGWGFTRPEVIADVLMASDDMDAANKAVRALIDADIVTLNPVEREIWVTPEAFAAFC